MNIFEKLTPKGRITRLEFWRKYFINLILYVLATVVYLIFVGGISMADLNSETNAPMIALLLLATIAISALGIRLFYPLICKRLHDIGKSSSTVWLASSVFTISGYAIPLYFFNNTDAWSDFAFITGIIVITLLIWYLVYFFMDSQPGINRYGISIKYPTAPPTPQKTHVFPNTRFNIITYSVIAVLETCRYLILSNDISIGADMLFYVILLTFAIRAYKHGYSLFSFFCLYAITSTLGLLIYTISNIIHSFNFYQDTLYIITTCIFIVAILVTVLALYSTGVLREKQHSSRPLWHVILILTAVVLSSIFYFYTVKLITTVILITSLKFLYEYFQKIQLTKTVSITLSVLLPLLLFGLPGFLFGDFSSYFIIEFISPCMVILLMSCILFSPKSLLITNGNTSSATNNAKAIHSICCVCVALVYLLFILLVYIA